MEAAKEIAALASLEIRRLLRSGRVVVLLCLYALFTALMVLIVGTIISAVQAQLDKQGVDASATAQLTQLRSGIIGAWLQDESAAAALEHVPIVVLVVFAFSLYWLPLYVSLLGYDAVSGELQHRSLRYLVIRARRGAILVGKGVSQFVVLAGLLLVIQVGVVGYGMYRTPDLTAAQAAALVGKLWIASCLFGASYVALTAWCSALFRSPPLALVVNLVALFVLWVVSGIGQRAALLGRIQGETSASAVLRYVSPFGYTQDLLHPQLMHFLQSAGAYAGFTALFGMAAYAVLRWRDV